MNGLLWTKQEEDIVRLYAGKKPLKLWVHELPNRNLLSIHQHAYSRMKLNVEVLKKPGELWWFTCGCNGVLPKQGESNLFAVWRGGIRPNWYCRVARLLGSGLAKGQDRGYEAIKQNTPHAIVRELMKAAMCWRCQEPMNWIFVAGKTPHLHHNHNTGEIYGFTHPHCNPLALEHQIDEMRDQIVALRNRLDNLERI